MSEQARVKLVCPECGGPLPLEAADRAVKCARCGLSSAPLAVEPAVVAPRVEKAVRESMACPRCNVSLFEGDAHGTPLLGCGSCGGVFLDNDASTRITRARDAVIAQLAERAKHHAAATSLDTRPKDLPCPSCTQPMKRVLARGVVELDFCATHGTWFDRGEVNRVMDAYAPRPDDSEVRMAAFRESQTRAIARAESASEAGAFGITLGVLGVLGALIASDS
jgi:Zn-finger nucleic acid-binding protein